MTRLLPALLLLPALACSSGSTASTAAPILLESGRTASLAALRLDKTP